ncbi:MAG: hypothetical protein RSE13_23735 [Planktothrix sp. GU0601_MAG3]|nr:MAG: hypothetical protein RSE13_23735 [Planktothrix sp. GU0601_MAG3]
MWVESVTLNNIKGFQNEIITFTRSATNVPNYRPKPYSWISLLGENVVSKSTLLRAIILLLAKPEASK